MTSLLNISTPFSSSHVVFIAHKSDALDTQVADLLAEELRWRKISYFLDKDTLILGDDFENRILSAVGSATLVVVLFPKESSHWVDFEAACAFFEQKLLPVSLAGSKIPAPYNRIQTHIVHIVDGREIYLQLMLSLTRLRKGYLVLRKIDKK